MSCDLRIGVGVDVHRLDPGRPLWLATLHWPGEVGLAGHSDADVAAHAACDSLLAAAGLGDLGTLFGTDDPRLAGASGAALLAETVTHLRSAGWEPRNVCVQIIGNRPKVSSRSVEAAAGMSKAAGCPVSVAGTTTDGLGLTGRGEGIAAIATALIGAPPRQG